MNSRYNRHIVLPEIGFSGQKKIEKAKVLVVGAGGLGCPILQYLTAAGVGIIGIIDFDNVEISNLQRQILFGTSSLGMNKAEAAKKRLEDLNPSITIIAYPEKLTHLNVISLFNQFDIIVDGTDNFETRYLINDACIITEKPLVFGAVYKFEGQVSVFNYNSGPSYRCVFPSPPQKELVPNCSEIGVLGILAGIVGTMQANEVLKIILNLGDVLSGKLWCYNALTNENMTITLKPSEEVINKIKRKTSLDDSSLNSLECTVEPLTESISELLLQDNVQFIDIREIDENPKITTLNTLHLPLSELDLRLDEVNNKIKKAFFCQKGIRSKNIVKILMNNGVSNCVCIKEGASEINNIVTNNLNILNERS